VTDKKLWKHQEECIEACENMDNFAMFFDPGTGKTRTSIEVVQRKYARANRMLRTLVLTPSVVTYNWKKEFAMYSNIPQSQIIVLSGSGAQRLKLLEKTPSYFVVICNYETLGMEPIFSFLKQWQPEVMIADESHRIKNGRAERTRRAITLSTFAKHKYILSGTPILQNSMDLWSQYMFLDGGKTLGKNNFTFKNQYFRDANKELRIKSPMVTWPKWVPLKTREKELTDKIMSCAMAVKKSECLDLPPYLNQIVEVDMTNEQWKAYKEMKEDYITFVNSKAFTAQLAITKALRLQQIVSGFLMGEKDGEPFTHVFEKTPREKALLDLVEDIITGNKVIIWACWRTNHDTIGRLLSKHKIEHRTLLGDMGQAERDRSIQDFRECDEVRVLLGSQAAGGIGINLVEANHTIYYSRSFSLEHDIQSEARNYRGGSEIHSSVTRIDLCTPGTIDETITKALQAKQEISDSIIQGKIIV
jgi:SNF2 family DNA or RNA helicase